MRVGRWFLLAACFVLAILPNGLIYATSVTVSIGVGETELIVSGITSPQAFVTIEDNGSVAATETADINGSFSHLLQSVSPGIHKISAYARDTDGRLSSTVHEQLNVTEHTTTAINLFLSPTVTMPLAIIRGNLMELSGQTAPGATVTINLDGSKTFQTTSATDGIWTYQMATKTLSGGTHKIFVQATTSGGEQSYPTSSYPFVIQVPPAPKPPSEPPPSPQSPETSANPPAGPSSASSRTSTNTPRVNNVDILPRMLVRVHGSAEKGAQIILYLNGAIEGSVLADGSGNWQLTATARAGKNRLQAQACVDGACSKLSKFFYFEYPKTGRAEPFQIALSQYYFYTRSGKAQLQIVLANGEVPYELHTDWGDGNDLTEHLTKQSVRLSHRYRKSGSYQGKIMVTDGEGRQAQTFFTVEVATPSYSLPFAISITLLTLAVIGFLSAHSYLVKIRVPLRK